MSAKRRVVAITGANGHVGRAVLARLEDQPFETVALVRRAVALPVDRVVVGALDEPKAQTALSQADVIIHLAGALRPQGENSYAQANLETAQAVAQAADGGDAERLIFLSYIHADPTADNAYLKTKGQAEQVLQASGKTVIVFRAAYIIGSPQDPGPQASGMQGPNGKAAPVLGDGQQLVSPVYVQDVAEALVAAVEQGGPGVYPIAGPETMKIDALAALVNASDGDLKHIPAFLARFLGLILPSLPSAMVDVMLQDSAGDPEHTAQVFKLDLHSLSSVWER